MQRFKACTQALTNFGKMKTTKKSLSSFWVYLLKTKKVYNKLTIMEQKEQPANYLRGDFDDVEVGFVDGLFEPYKLRERIAKYKAEIIYIELLAQSNTDMEHICSTVTLLSDLLG